MTIDEAEALLSAIPPHTGDWADLGAGDGTFAQALARRLQPGSRLYAVDRNSNAIASLRRLVVPDVEIIPVAGDFTRPLQLPGTGEASCTGSVDRLPDIMDGLGLAPPTVTATRPSVYGGSLYVAVTQRHS